MHLVRAHVPRQPLGPVDPGLGDEHAVVVGVHDSPPLAVDLVHAVLVPHRGRVVAAQQLLLGVPLGQALGLDQRVGDVDAEAGNAAVQPEAQDVVELLADLRVGPVEVGLLDVEQVQVPLAGRAVGLADAGPGGAAEDAAPGVGWLVAVLAQTVAEQVPRALTAARRRGDSGLEPRVLVGRVVRNQVDDDAQAEPAGLRQQGVGVRQGAEERVHVAVVGDVVAGVRHR